MNKEAMIKERLLKTVEIANTDPEGQKLAHKLNDGKLVVQVKDDLELAIEVCDGHLTVVQDASHPKAVCAFSDADTAWALLNKKMSPYAATVHKQLNQYGLSPMNETFEKIWLLACDRLTDEQ